MGIIYTGSREWSKVFTTLMIYRMVRFDKKKVLFFHVLTCVFLGIRDFKKMINPQPTLRVNIHV